MNYLELQQRANILVQKVNEYESSLTGQTIDENTILEQHQYADIYSLRPVLKMLFGKTLNERLSRTLLNDIDLRLFASSSPMWTSTFGLLSSYSPGFQNVTGTPTSAYVIQSTLPEFKPAGSTEGACIELNVGNTLNSTYNTYIICFTTGSDVQTSQAFLYDSYYTRSIQVYQGAIYFLTANPISVEPNTKYYLKFSYNSNVYASTEVSISTDGITYSTPQPATGLHSSGRLPKVLGKFKYNIAPQQAFLGTFHLDECYGYVISSYVPMFQNGVIGFQTLKVNSSLGSSSSLTGSIYCEDSGSIFCTGLDGGTSFKFTYTFPDLSYSPNEYILFKFNLVLGKYYNSSQSRSLIPTFETSRGYYNFQTSRPNSGSINFDFSIGRDLSFNCQDYDTFSVSMKATIGNNNSIAILTTIKNLRTGSEKTSTYTFNSATMTSLYFSPYPNNMVSSSYTDITCGFESPGFSVDYQSNNRHQFINDINLYNNYNMIAHDVQTNTFNNRDVRIKSGINYSYSSNIQDALVTESQVANMFRWNTTNSETILNNTMSVNRQVPGIVTYYLGTDYDSTYTATIPYSQRIDNINSVNYSTPPYYGAYYMTDETQSLIGLSMGAEACRIFMPGLNYTRGYLESPQQIWQPDRLVGESNVGLGYNWQGGAVYHELVFKRRRQGASDNKVDLIPSLSSDDDNDPQ